MPHGRRRHAVGNRFAAFRSPGPAGPRDSLQEALAAKERELAARDAEIHAKTLHIEKLRATLALMKRARFGRSSRQIDQLELLIGDLEEEAAEQQARRDAAVERRPAQVVTSPPWPSATAGPPAA